MIVDHVVDNDKTQRESERKIIMKCWMCMWESNKELIEFNVASEKHCSCNAVFRHRWCARYPTIIQTDTMTLCVSACTCMAFHCASSVRISCRFGNYFPQQDKLTIMSIIVVIIRRMNDGNARTFPRRHPFEITSLRSKSCYQTLKVPWQTLHTMKYIELPWDVPPAIDSTWTSLYNCGTPDRQTLAEISNCHKIISGPNVLIADGMFPDNDECIRGELGIKIPSSSILQNGLQMFTWHI